MRIPIRFKLAGAIAGVALLASAPRAQQAPVRDAVRAMSASGTGAISGTVVLDGQPGGPVRRARVQLNLPDPNTPRFAITDDNGAFAFTGLPAGRYGSVSATRRGYVSVYYGSKRPGDATGAMSIMLADGQQIAGLTLRMPHGAVITGTVVDQRGQPAARAFVLVFRSRFDSRTGTRTFQEWNGEDADEKGNYRIYGLPAGDYIVAATASDDVADFRLPTAAEWRWADGQLRAPSGAGTQASAPPEPGPTLAYAPVYHPGTPVRANAAVIKLGTAEERGGVDIRLELIPTAKITGTLRAPEGVSPTRFFVTTIRNEDGRSEVQWRVTPDANGAFSITTLAPGSYTIVAGGAPPGAGGGPATPPRFWGAVDVTVNGRDQDVALDLQPALPVSGQLAFDGTAEKPADLTRVRILLTPMSFGGGLINFPGGLASLATVDANGRFTFGAIAPGQYRLTANVPSPLPTSGWIARSALIGDRDVLDTPLDVKAGDRIEAVVTFTDRPAELSGTLQDTTGRPTPDYFIVVFPRDHAFWTPQSRRVTAVRPGIDGRYRVPNLPAGEYLLSAVADIESGQWFDPSLLSELEAAAIRITLAEGDKKTQDLRIGGGS